MGLSKYEQRRNKELMKNRVIPLYNEGFSLRMIEAAIQKERSYEWIRQHLEKAKREGVLTEVDR